MHFFSLKQKLSTGVLSFISNEFCLPSLSTMKNSFNNRFAIIKSQVHNIAQN